MLDIYAFYPEEPALKEVLETHSRMVADLSLEICRSHPELEADTVFIEEAAMLHDIGISECNAPDIHCHGDQPYIRHGVIGSERLMRS
ncbi:MAG: HD domain-containing protein, partial [Muribaculaceae bacterium]|nr:HD domain-containing protein [Muribaculaceae bacterium]